MHFCENNNKRIAAFDSLAVLEAKEDKQHFMQGHATLLLEENHGFDSRAVSHSHAKRHGRLARVEGRQTENARESCISSPAGRLREIHGAIEAQFKNNLNQSDSWKRQFSARQANHRT